MNYDTLKRAVKNIEAKGFTHIKVELEACAYDTLSGYFYDNMENHLRAEFSRLFSTLSYIRVYYDGSVNVEATFTVPISDARYLPKALKIFTNYLDRDGWSQSDTRRKAGMHIAIMRGADLNALPDHTIGVNDFMTKMATFVPALMLISSDGTNYKRPTHYCRPQVTARRLNKYGAITVGTSGNERSGIIEYRLFDTCYSNPQRILEYIALISRTLKYYTTHQESDPLTQKLTNLARQLSYRSHSSFSIANEVREAGFSADEIAAFLKPLLKRGALKKGTVSMNRVINSLA